MNDFYRLTTDVLVEKDAFIDKMVGDAVFAIFIPAFTGPNHARASVQAAHDLLFRQDPANSLPFGIGVHTGTALFGTVKGADGTLEDLTALGDNVNLAARIASLAGPGEALISDAAATGPGLDLAALEERRLKVKGRRKPVSVRVLTKAII
jgi:adenylate cyclase